MTTVSPISDAAPSRAAHAPNGPEPAPQPAIVPPDDLVLVKQDVSRESQDRLSRQPAVYNRELSWLDFNWRVLQEALDPQNDLLERLNFLSITASNMDEFFRKRVGGLKRQQAAGAANLRLQQGWTPDFQLGLINKVVTHFYQQQDACLLQDLLPQLERHGVRLVDYKELSVAEVSGLRERFFRDIFPLLTPLAFDPAHPFPFISNLSLNLVVEAQDRSNGKTRVVRMKVPPNRARWLRVGEGDAFVPLEQVLIHNLDTVFSGMDILHVHPFRVTRNAALQRIEEEADDLLEMISEELQERRFAPVVRLEIAPHLPEHILAILLHQFGLSMQDVYQVQGPLGLADVRSLYGIIDLPELKSRPWQPQTPPQFAHLNQDSHPSEIFQMLKHGDVLLHHPYQSFANSTQLLFLAAARDPQVLAIKHTMYRTSDDSPIVDSLISAAQSGKQVAVLVEVKARFDEEQNIYHSKRLEDAGCHVTYGLVGLKAHTKISLIVREEANGLQSYVHVGTGNYHPSTANLYTDLGLLTTDKAIVADVMDLFNYLTGFNRRAAYKKLLVAPVNMRRRFKDMIQREMEQVKACGSGRIIAKMNGLDDPELVVQLYKASQAGVKIDLIVRGLCRVRPGIPGISDNISVVSIIGRFLEHHRIFYFANNDQPEYYIGSADWMQRNLDNRVEAIVPVEEPEMQRQLREILDYCLEDERNAWDMQADSRYRQRRSLLLSGSDAGDRISPRLRDTHAELMRNAAQKVILTDPASPFSRALH